MRAALNTGVSWWRPRRREIPLASHDAAALADPAGGVDAAVLAALRRLQARQREVIALRVFRTWTPRPPPRFSGSPPAQSPRTCPALRRPCAASQPCTAWPVLRTPVPRITEVSSQRDIDDVLLQARDALSGARMDTPVEAILATGRSRRHRRRLAQLSAAVAASGALALGLATVIGSGSPAPALAAVTGALTRTLTQSYHLTEHGGVITSRTAGSPTALTGRVRAWQTWRGVSRRFPARTSRASWWAARWAATGITTAPFPCTVSAGPRIPAACPAPAVRRRQWFHRRHTSADAGRDQEGRQGHRGRARLGAWVDRHPVRVQRDIPGGDEDHTQGCRGCGPARTSPGTRPDHPDTRRCLCIRQHVFPDVQRLRGAGDGHSPASGSDIFQPPLLISR